VEKKILHRSHLDSRPALRGEQRSRNADRMARGVGYPAVACETRYSSIWIRRNERDVRMW
jgi:hypothetical protein